MSEGFLQRMKNWRYGVRRLTIEDLRGLRQIRNGKLIQARPKVGKLPVESLPNAFLPLWVLRKSSFSFEIWSQHGEPRFYLWASDGSAMKEFEAQFHAVYPKSDFLPTELRYPEVEEGSYICSATIAFEGEPFGLKTLREFKYDPLRHLLELAKQCDCVVQVMFRPLRKLPKELKPHMARLLSNNRSQPSRRAATPLFEVMIRIITMSDEAWRAREAIELLGDAFIIFSSKFSYLRPRITSFRIPLRRDHLLEHMVRRDFPRFSKKKKFVLTIGELATFVHLPPELDTTTGVMTIPHLKPAPDSSIALGYSTLSGGRRELAGLELEDMGNVYLCGAPGTGKTTMLINVALQAFNAGYCCWVIDPHGDMADDLVQSVHHDQMDRVALLDPFEVSFSLNPLELPPCLGEAEKQSAVERIVGEVTDMIQRLFGRYYWGPSLNRTFQNSLRALYSFSDSPTFEDMAKVLLGQGDFGSKDVMEFQQEMARLPHERIDAVLNKIDPFVKNQTLNRLFCRRSTLNLEELTRPASLVVWRLSKAKLTGPALNLAGAAIVTRLWFYVAARPRGERSPVMFIIDEFQNFAGLETLGIMLAEGRKYQIQLVLAHQHLQQLRQQVSINDVLANTMTKITFRVSGEDATVLARTFDPSRVRDFVARLTSLPNGRALVKLRAGFGGEQQTSCFEISTLPPPTRRSVDIDGLIEIARGKFNSAPPLEEKPQDERVNPQVTELLKIINELHNNGEEPIVSKILERFTPKIKRGSELSRIIDRAQSMGLVNREVVKVSRGRPKVFVTLTDKAKQLLGEGSKVSPEGGFSLGGAKAGGELHRALIMNAAKFYQGGGYRVEIPEQAGRKEQADLIVYPEEKGDDDPYADEPFAVEVETSGKHPEQVARNYWKNANRGMDILFIVPDEGTRDRVLRILKQYEISAPVCVIEYE